VRTAGSFVTKVLRSLRASSQIALTAAAIVTVGAFSGCSNKADEPGKGVVGDSTPHVKPLKYNVPQAWTKTESSDDGERRAAYSVPKAGDDKEDGEVLVLFFGTGSGGDRDKQWDIWFGQFDGDPKSIATRGSFDANGAEVETFETTGRYKLNIGPQRPGMKRSPVQMVKDNFRMIGAVVHTKDRGNWFFRLVGPDATVKAAKSDFLGLLQSVE
jgi:hypothetical protein